MSQPHLRVLGGYSAVVAVNVAIQASLFPAASSLSDIYSTVTSALSTAAGVSPFEIVTKEFTHHIHMVFSQIVLIYSQNIRCL